MLYATLGSLHTGVDSDHSATNCRPSCHNRSSEAGLSLMPTPLRLRLETGNKLDLELYAYAETLFHERCRSLLGDRCCAVDVASESKSEPPEQKTAPRAVVSKSSWSDVDCRGEDGASEDKVGKEKRLTIVTGADSTHVVALWTLSLTVVAHSPCARMVVWDLGLQQEHRKVLSDMFDDIDRQLGMGPLHVIKTFDFSKYPHHFMMKAGAIDETGRPEGRTYGWKGQIIQNTADTHGGQILWLDGDNRVVGDLSHATDLLSRDGMLTVLTTGRAWRSTHETMLERFKVKLQAKVEDWNNLNAAILGFDTENEEIVNKVD
eukprot:scaffold1167_cov418-Prasinococcus_capsulatus_cf.AAC.6